MERAPAGSQAVRATTQAWQNAPWVHRLTPLGFVLLALVLYYPALRAGIVADDFVLVGRVGLGEALRFFHETFGFGRNEYRPLTALTYALDRWLWSGAPAGYHLTNIVLHGACSALLAALLRRLTGSMVLAVVAALAFLLHPTHHERVVWISARDALVSSVFLLMAGWIYAGAVLSERHGRRLWAMIPAGCAMLAYEGAVVLPGFLWLTDLLLLARGGGWKKAVWDSLRRALPFFVLGAGYLVLWQAMFRAELGAYALTPSLSGIAGNYGSLLYNLFYGHRRLVFGIAYLIILAAGWRALVRGATAAVGAWGAASALLAFAPFCIIEGFAPRFSYSSAMGWAAWMGVCLTGPWTCGHSRRGHSQKIRAVVLVMGLGMAGFYVVEVRKAIADWSAAGEIAARVLHTVKSLHPQLQPDTILIFHQMPRTHGRALVFPTGLPEAIEGQYGQRVEVRELDEPGLLPSPPHAGPEQRPVLRFRYDSALGTIVEIS